MSAAAPLDPPHRDALCAALATAKTRYAERRPASRAEWQSAARVMPGGNTRTILYFDPFPVCMASGSGCDLEDLDGFRYVDLLGEYTAGIYGHSNPVIQAVVIEALRNGVSLSAHNRAEVRLAALLCARYHSIELVRFTNSGTEANLLALATAQAFTGRERVLVFEDAYHGSLLKFGEPRSPINVPHHFIVAPYNDIDAARASIREHAGNLACILVEPMLGAGGCIPGDPTFLGMLAQEAHAARSLLIFDEIQTARLSAGGCQALLGITPDLTTLGKYHGGGLSFGAFGGRAEVMSLYDPRRPGALAHAGTFNNNVLSMAAGYAGLATVDGRGARHVEPARRCAARAAQRAPRRGRCEIRAHGSGLAHELSLHRRSGMRIDGPCSAALRPVGARLLHGAARIHRALASGGGCDARIVRRCGARGDAHARGGVLRALAAGRAWWASAECERGTGRGRLVGSHAVRGAPRHHTDCCEPLQHRLLLSK